MIRELATMNGATTAGICAAVWALGQAFAAWETPLDAQLRRGAVKELATGKLLVAARNLPDPNFSDTVVLVAELNDEGAMGLILNRPTDIPLDRFVPGLAEGANTDTAFVGGPVQPRGALGLLRSATPEGEARHVSGDVYLVNTRELLYGLIRTGTGPNRFRLFLGYAGWGPEQLQEETARGSWYVLDGDGGLVFDRDPETLWQRLIRRAGALSVKSRPSLLPVFPPPV